MGTFVTFVKIYWSVPFTGTVWPASQADPQIRPDSSRAAAGGLGQRDRRALTQPRGS